ncbi:MAG: hypothetical protein OJF50_001819 [Nitrospira sp.]|nr:hypothetical protein [Nitrospira sp.]
MGHCIPPWSHRSLRVISSAVVLTAGLHRTAMARLSDRGASGYPNK